MESRLVGGSGESKRKELMNPKQKVPDLEFCAVVRLLYFQVISSASTWKIKVLGV